MVSVWEDISSIVRCRQTPGGSTPDGSEILTEAGKAGIEQFAPRNDDEVVALARFTRQFLPEHLSDQTFSPVSIDRASEFPGGDYAQAPRTGAIGPQQNRQITAVKPLPVFEDALEVCPSTNAPRFRERVAAGHGRATGEGLRTGHGQPLATLGAAALQDETAILGGHPHQESVRTRTAATIGLKRALAFHDFRYPCSIR
jgi:hypothetical protein